MQDKEKKSKLGEHAPIRPNKRCSNRKATNICNTALPVSTEAELDNNNKTTNPTANKALLKDIQNVRLNKPTQPIRHQRKRTCQTKQP